MPSNSEGRPWRAGATQLRGKPLAGLTTWPGSPMDGVELWWADLDEGANVSRDGWLSDAELARAGRFRLARDSTRYKTCRALLRLLLADHLGCSPAAVPLTTGVHGKPRLAGHANLNFNVSHSGSLALFGVTSLGPLGVDIEARDERFDDFEATAAVCLTAGELEELSSRPQAERFSAFLRGWTRKEACLKAIGSGFAIEPTEVDAGLSCVPRELSLFVDGAECRVAVTSLDETDEFVAALALLHASSRHLAL